MMFNFEFDFAGNLQCIPMIVRFNLDQCGIKLSLKQWNRFAQKERVRLIEQLCRTKDEIEEYRSLLTALILRTGEAPEEIEVEPMPVWRDVLQVPPRLQAYALDMGIVPPCLDMWRDLTALQRFALFKLTRPGHKNENFLLAMIEFDVTGGQNTPVSSGKSADLSPLSSSRFE